MTYILDTNICIYLLNGNKNIESKIKSIGIYSVAITYSILAELYYGAYNSGRVKENLSRIDEFKKNLIIFQECAESAALFGKIKSQLKSAGNLIDDFDILIGSIALANDCTIVTNNESHFNRIKKLRLVNWYR